MDQATMERLLEEISTNTKGLGGRMKGIEDGQKKLREDFDGAIKRLEFLETASKQRGISLPGSEEETFRGEKFSYARAIRFLLAVRAGHGAAADKVAPLEAAILREATEKADHMPSENYVGKDMEAGNDTLGGFLVPNQIQNILIELIRARAVLLLAGATPMPGLTGSPVEIPREDTDTTAYWVGEVEAPNASDMELGRLLLEPHTGAARTILSQRLLRMSSPSAEMIVRRSLSAKLALLIDLAGLRGTGTGGQPLGIVNALNVNSVPIGTNGGDVTDDILIDIISAVRNADGLVDAQRVGWFMPPQILARLEKLKDSNGRSLYSRSAEGSLENPAPAQRGDGLLKGYPVFTTSQMPTNLTKGSGTGLGEIIFGDIATVIFGQWGGLELRVSDQTEDAFKKRQVHVLAFQEVDFCVQQPKRLAVCSDAKTA